MALISLDANKAELEWIWQESNVSVGSNAKLQKM